MKYIPPNKGPVYRLLAGLSSTYRYALLIFFCGSIAYIWFHLLYQPLQRYIHRYTACVNTLNNQCTLNTQQNAHTAQLCNSTDELRKTLYGESNVPADHAPCCMTLLVEQAHKQGLRFISYMHDAQQEKDAIVHKRMRFVFEGELQQLSSFFKQLACEHLSISCSAFELSRMPNNSFSCSCLLDMYTYNPDNATQ